MLNADGVSNQMDALLGQKWSVLLTKYCAGSKIEKNEMGGACGTYGGGERVAQGSGGETWGKETTEETQT